MFTSHAITLAKSKQNEYYIWEPEFNKFPMSGYRKWSEMTFLSNQDNVLYKAILKNKSNLLQENVHYTGIILGCSLRFGNDTLRFSKYIKHYIAIFV